MREKSTDPEANSATNVISITDRIARRSSSLAAPANPTFADALQAVVKARLVESGAATRRGPAVVLDFSDRRRDG